MWAFTWALHALKLIKSMLLPCVFLLLWGAGGVSRLWSLVVFSCKSERQRCGEVHLLGGDFRGLWKVVLRRGWGQSARQPQDLGQRKSSWNRSHRQEYSSYCCGLVIRWFWICAILGTKFHYGANISLLWKSMEERCLVVKKQTITNLGTEQLVCFSRIWGWHFFSSCSKHDGSTVTGSLAIVLVQFGWSLACFPLVNIIQWL